MVPDSTPVLTSRRETELKQTHGQRPETVHPVPHAERFSFPGP